MSLCYALHEMKGEKDMLELEHIKNHMMAHRF